MARRTSSLPARARPARPALAVALALAGATGVLLALLAPRDGLLLHAETAPQPESAPSVLAPADSARSARTAAALREPGPASQPVGQAAVPCADFASMFGRMVARLVATRAALPPGARRTRADWEREFAPEARRILACHQDAGELALQAVHESLDQPLAQREPLLQCGILLSAIALETLQGLRATPVARTRLDALVHQHLETMALEEPLGRVIGRSVLEGKPYLGAAHEARVRAMLNPDPKAAWLPALARPLLLTLWRNLLATGDISQEELDRRTQALADTTAGPTRIAALQQLLESDAAQHADWILASIESSGDAELVSQVAMALAGHLPAAQAVTALSRLQATRPYHAILAAWHVLAERSPEHLQAAYEARLADDVDQPARAAFMSALGMCRRDANAPGLRLAVVHDPALEVRGNALLGLVASPTRAIAETALREALVDRRFGAEPRGAAYLTFALESYCMGPSPSADLVANLGQRILQLATLRPEHRDQVEALVRRFTPGR